MPSLKLWQVKKFVRINLEFDGFINSVNQIFFSHLPGEMFFVTSSGISMKRLLCHTLLRSVIEHSCLLNSVHPFTLLLNKSLISVRSSSVKAILGTRKKEVLSK